MKEEKLIRKLSIIIPVFNEKNTILEILRRVDAVNLGFVEKEVIIVDDFSTDGTRELLKSLNGDYQIVYQDRNYGKGFGLRTGFQKATGDYILVQDADLEYDPQDYLILINKVKKEGAQVVYGSRQLGLGNKNHSSIAFYMGGLLVTKIANFLYNMHLTDVPTGYKMFSRDIINRIKLDCSRFEFCPEITAKIAKKGIKICEVPVNYYPRGFSEGKKIRWFDGLEAVWVLIKYRFKK